MGRKHRVDPLPYLQGRKRRKVYNVSRFGLALRRQAGKQRDLGSNLLRLSFLFKSCGVWIPSCDFVPHNYETLKGSHRCPS